MIFVPVFKVLYAAAWQCACCMPDGLEAGRRADPDQRCAVTACEVMLLVRGKVEGLALLGPVGFASDVDADAALQDIAELFALMWVVRVSAAAGFQRDEDWLHHVFLRVRDDPADLIFQLRIVFFKIVSLSEYDLLLRCFIKKLNIMRKSVLFIILLFAVGMTAQAQKFALIDMEYILKNIPAYERANEQLSQATKQWQGEVEVLAKEAQTMFKDYQAASAKLTAAQKTQKEDAIVEKEIAASELKRKYFGPEGELFKKREELMKPIQDEIYNAVKAVAEENGYAVVVDRETSLSLQFTMIFTKR